MVNMTMQHLALALGWGSEDPGLAVWGQGCVQGYHMQAPLPFHLPFLLLLTGLLALLI